MQLTGQPAQIVRRISVNLHVYPLLLSLFIQEEQKIEKGLFSDTGFPKGQHASSALTYLKCTGDNDVLSSEDATSPALHDCCSRLLHSR